MCRPDQFAATVKDQVDWLKAHKVDVVLVGLQFAPEMLRDAHYKLIRDTLRKVAAREKVIVIRFYEAMEILNKAAETGQPVAEQFERSEEGYDCLAQYVAHAITLGVFAKNMPKRTGAEVRLVARHAGCARLRKALARTRRTRAYSGTPSTGVAAAEIMERVAASAIAAARPLAMQA